MEARQEVRPKEAVRQPTKKKRQTERHVRWTNPQHYRLGQPRSL